MTDYPTAYHPDIVLSSSEFKLVEGTPARDTSKNLACAYGPNQLLSLIEKPVPTARAGEVVVHIRACGICGSDCHFWKVSRESVGRENG